MNRAHARYATLVLLLTTITLRAMAQDQPRFTDKVDVPRILLDVRVIDPRGRPVLGLEPADFEVRIDGRIARVESVQHITGQPAATSESAETRGQTTTTAVPTVTQGRLVVFLFQKNLHGSRIPGVMLMLRELRRSLETFPRHDQVAVLRFDSRLHLLQDFSQDRDRLRTALEQGVLFGGAAEPGESRVPSLRPTLEGERLAASYSMEQALRRVAKALEPLPGPKSLVIVGHGFGRLGSMGVTREPAYDDAREALQRARVSVFCLDVTNADHHSLEAGLKIVAADTGGFYQRTHVFSRAALNRVIAALEGQYVLFVEKPPLGSGAHPVAREGIRHVRRLEVRLRAGAGVVLAPSVYVD